MNKLEYILQNLSAIEELMADPNNLITDKSMFFPAQTVQVTDSHIFFEDTHGNAERLTYEEMGTSRAGFTAASISGRSALMAGALMGLPAEVAPPDPAAYVEPGAEVTGIRQATPGELPRIIFIVEED